MTGNQNTTIGDKQSKKDINGTKPEIETTPLNLKPNQIQKNHGIPKTPTGKGRL